MDENRLFDRQQAQEKAFQFLLRFDGTPASLETIGNMLVNYFRKEFGTEGPLRHIRENIHSATAQLEADLKLRQKRNDAAAKAMLNDLNRTMNAGSTYSGLGFSVITDTAGAVAYAALDAWERYKHDILQNQKAYKQLAEDLRRVQILDADGCTQSLAAEVEYAFDLIEAYWKAKRFAAEHKSFYVGEQHDLGLELGGTNVYRLLQKICAEDSACLDIWERDGVDYDKLFEKGYIDSYGYRPRTIFSTGKYEKWAMEVLYDRNHPEEAAKKQQKKQQESDALRAEAQKALEQKAYHRAATLFGQLYEDEEALRMAARIWHAHLMDIPMVVYPDRIVSADGRAISLAENKRIPVITEPGKPIKQLEVMDRCNISLQMDGHVWFPPEYREDERRLPRSVYKWSQVVELFKHNNYLFGIHQDGHVSCERITPYADPYLVDSLTNVKKLQMIGKNLIALTWDGRVQVLGQPQEGLEVCTRWERIKDISCPDTNLLVAITEDDRILLAGEVKDAYKPAEQWRDVVQVRATGETIVAITKDGTLLQSGVPFYNEEDPEEKKAVRSLVRFGFTYQYNHWYALRSDGNIICCAEEWKPKLVPPNGAVGLLDSKTVVCVDGRLIKEGQVAGRCFENIETVRQERRLAMEKLLRQKQEALQKTSVFSFGKKSGLKEDIAFLQKEIEKYS